MTEADRCPQCGVALVRPWDAERPRLNHAAGSKSCRVRAFAREADERDLVRVTGDMGIELDRFGVSVVYGPICEGYEGDGAFAARGPKSRFTTAVFAPRWAAALIELGTISTLGWGDRLRGAFARAKHDERFRLAIASTAMLLADAASSQRKSALAALIREGTKL